MRARKVIGRTAQSIELIAPFAELRERLLDRDARVHHERMPARARWLSTSSLAFLIAAIRSCAPHVLAQIAFACVRRAGR